MRASSWDIRPPSGRKSQTPNPKPQRSVPPSPAGGEEGGGVCWDLGFGILYFPSEVALFLLLFHRRGLVEVDQAALALGKAGEEHLLDDLGQRGRLGLHGARERIAAERPEADGLHHGLLARLEGQALVVDHDESAVAV